MSRKKLEKSLDQFDKSKKSEVEQLSGNLGIPLGGNYQIRVIGRPGYVYVRLRGSQNELIQAYNGVVADVYDLPVLVIRENRTYKIIGRDIARYSNWGDSAYLPNHHTQHEFDPQSKMGADVVWVHSEQFLPLAAFPSGTSESLNLLIYPYTYDWGGIWKRASQTGTASLAPFIPGISGVSRAVLIYLDGQTSLPKLAGGNLFATVTNGIDGILPYIPTIPSSVGIPLAVVVLESGTTSIGWDKIYDVRQYYNNNPSGTGGGISNIGITDEGISKGSVTVLDFVGEGVNASVSGTVARIFVTGSSSAGMSSLLVLSSGTFMVSGTSFDFRDGLYATASGTTAYIFSKSRETLKANRTYYVRTDGNDSNTGLANTSGGAFLTIQKAVDVISGLDINGQIVTVQIADGTYTGGTVLKNVVGFAAEGNLIIQGNNGTPSNVVISPTNDNCFSATSLTSVWYIKDMKLQTTTSGMCIWATFCRILFNNIDFGACAGFHLFADGGGNLQAMGNYSITGGATYHFVSSLGSSLRAQNVTVTLTGTPAFTTFAYCEFVSFLAVNSSTFSGSASAGTKKYDVTANGTLALFGTTLPGGVAGTTATGGQVL